MKPSVNRTSTLGTVQWAVTYLLQEPVKEGVREAFREENVTVEGDRPTSSDESSESSSGPSALSLGIGLLVIGGLAYYARKRQQSTSEWSAESESTPEHRAGESRGEPGGSGGQTTSVSDQG